MVETITPVVYGGRGRWRAALALHVLGATLAAAAFGAALGAVGALLQAPWLAAGAAAIAAFALTYAVGELPGVAVPVPALRQQVPDWWRTYFGWRAAAFLYGAGLGIGFFTFLTHGTLVVVAVGAAATGRPVLGAALLAPFGVARGISAAAASRVDSQEAGQRLVDRLAGTPDGRRAVANGLALALTAVLAASDTLRLEGGWVELAGAALAATFAWAAIAKVGGARRWRRTLEAHRLPAGLTRAAMWGVPSAEAVVPLLALLGRPRAAAGWALIVLAAFSIEVVRARIRVGSHVPCGCFGGRSTAGAPALLARNLGLATVAIWVVRRGVGDPLIGWPGSPGAGEVLPMTLAIVGLGVATFTAWRTATWLGRGRRA